MKKRFVAAIVFSLVTSLCFTTGCKKDDNKNQNTSTENAEDGTQNNSEWSDEYILCCPSVEELNDIDFIEGIEFTIAVGEDRAEKLSAEDIVLSKAFEDLTVNDVNKSDTYMVSFVLKGTLKEGYEQGGISLKDCPDYYEEFSIVQKEYKVDSFIDRYSEEHEFSIYCDSFIERDCSIDEVKVVDEENIVVSKVEAHEGCINIKLTGRVSDANYLSLYISKELANSYNAMLIEILVDEPQIEMKNVWVDKIATDELYMKAVGFEFNEDISVDDVDIIFSEDSEIKQYIKIISVDYVYDTLNVDVQIDSEYWKHALNLTDNVADIVIKDNGTTLARDIKCKMILPSVYCDYNYSSTDDKENVIIKGEADLDYAKVAPKDNMVVQMLDADGKEVPFTLVSLTPEDDDLIFEISTKKFHGDRTLIIKNAIVAEKYDYTYDAVFIIANADM